MQKRYVNVKLPVELSDEVDKILEKSSCDTVRGQSLLLKPFEINSYKLRNRLILEIFNFSTLQDQPWAASLHTEGAIEGLGHFPSSLDKN